MEIDRRALIWAAVAVLVLSVVATLVVGLRPLTRLADLNPAGGYDGLVAFVDDSRMAEQCLHIVDLGRGDETRNAHCDLWVSVVGFTADGVLFESDELATNRTDSDWEFGRVGLLSVNGGAVTLVEDPQFGDRLPSPSFEDFDSRDAKLVIDGVTVVELNGPSDYAIEWHRVSPDGSQVLLFVSAGRVIVARTDGSGEPQLVTDRASSAVWQVS
jgi:hypothetical protein